MTPQVIVTLSPAGDLQVELPGTNGSRRVVPLTGDIEAALHRMLRAQARGERLIGSDAEPTEAQLRHFGHSAPVETCVFCKLEIQHAEKYCNVKKFDRRGKRVIDADGLLKEAGLL